MTAAQATVPSCAGQNVVTFWFVPLYTTIATRAACLPWVALGSRTLEDGSMTGVKALPDLEGSGIFQGLLASRPLVMDRSRDAFWACVSKCSSEKCRPVRATRFCSRLCPSLSHAARACWRAVRGFVRKCYWVLRSGACPGLCPEAVRAVCSGAARAVRGCTALLPGLAVPY